MNYIEYFKNKPGFHRFILSLKQKYESKGNFNGSIKLKNITEEEKVAFEQFFGEIYETGENVNIPMSKFNKVISKSNFKDFSHYKLVTGYLNIDKIKTNKERRNEKEDAYIDFLNDTLNILKNREFVDYLVDNIMKKNKTSKIIKARYTKNRNSLANDLKKIDKLFMNIPKYPTSMPIYASITGNPHYLDFNTNTGTLFLRFLSEMKHKKIETIEQKWYLLESINIYNDTISNYTLTNNLKGNKYIDDYNNNLGPININLDNINNIDKITGINNQIFIFENPSMLNYFKKDNISIIITSGIPNLSFYRLMEKIDINTQVYYNGDFDPEGLLIANKLKLLYPKLNLFCYRKKDYNNDNATEIINKARLKKLEHVNVYDLREIKMVLEEKKLASYQENNLHNIEEQIKIISAN